LTYDILIDGTSHRLELNQAEGGWHCRLDGEEVHVDAVLARPNVISLIIDGVAYEVKRELTPTDTHIWVKSARFAAEVRDPRSLRSRRGKGTGTEGPQKLVAPMPGKIVRVLANPGEAVEAGQGLIVIEAMKMQNELKSPKKGTVSQVLAKDGSTVTAGEVLAIVE
jgi:biotin carboxyl carrier protein